MGDLFCSGFDAVEESLVTPVREKIRNDISLINDLKANISITRGQVTNAKRDLTVLRRTGGTLARKNALRARMEMLRSQLDLLIPQKTAYRSRAACCRDCISDYETNRASADFTNCINTCNAINVIS